MKTSIRIAAVVAVLIAAAFTATPPSGACCIPCQNFCNQPGVPGSALCCTGIPTPGDACGLTTCCKYLGRRCLSTAAVDSVS